MAGLMTRQKGMTLTGFLVMFTLVGFFTMLAVKLTPDYLRHYKIKSTLQTIATDPSVSEKSTKEITEMLQKKWDMNSVDRISAQDSVFFERVGKLLKIQVTYEVEEHLFGNVSVLLKFDDSVSVGTAN